MENEGGSRCFYWIVFNSSVLWQVVPSLTRIVKYMSMSKKMISLCFYSLPMDPLLLCCWLMSSWKPLHLFFFSGLSGKQVFDLLNVHMDICFVSFSNYHWSFPPQSCCAQLLIKMNMLLYKLHSPVLLMDDWEKFMHLWLFSVLFRFSLFSPIVVHLSHPHRKPWTCQFGSDVWFLFSLVSFWPSFKDPVVVINHSII